MNQYEIRRNQIERNIPELFYPPPGKSLLYVGASPPRRQFLEEFIKLYRVTIIEAYEPNHLFLAYNYQDLFHDSRVICEDIQNVAVTNQPLEMYYDIIFWWHGPEHIPFENLAPCLANLEAMSPLVVLGAPWGVNEQGPAYGNQFENHLWSVEPFVFAELGYTTDTVGPRSTKENRHFMSNILAWKRNKVEP